MKKKLLILLLFVGIGAIDAQAQVLSPSQLQQMKVDDLSDEQVRQVVEEMKKNRVGLDQLDGFAQQKGIPASEVSKLKSRIKLLNLDSELVYKNTTVDVQQQADRSINDGTTISARDIQPMTEAEKKRSKIFGAELFSNKSITFEPNLRMPTPANYQLASGDELIIDVYGYSEVQHTLKISPEGYIRIPNLGPVYLNGVTIEEARNRIIKQLSTIYSGIRAGNTFVQVSLGNIRSIKVLLIGEVVRPGTYTLPSLATVANALYVSGGPDENGSFRNIQVIRNGQPITTFDLYDFLRNGELTNNIVLQDQDIVKIAPYVTRIELTGEVKRPAIFEVKNGESLKDIIDLAGGYTDIAYTDIIRAYRINNKEREVVNIPSAEIQNFQLQAGDKFFIEPVLNRFSNRVMITGAILHPGEYALEKSMTVKDLIQKAAGVKEDAMEGRAIIFRKASDFTPVSTSFNLGEILSGTTAVPLNREDSVVIYSKLGLRENYQVKINGEVRLPGYYPYSDSLQIEDLILMAGGLNDAASLLKVEVARRIRNPHATASDSSLSIIALMDINAELTSNKKFVLQPFDEVFIRKSPNYSDQVNISIEGEVMYPGSYSMNTTREKVSDLLRRAGGLKSEAYPEGAVLLRKTFINPSDSLLLHNKLRVYVNTLKDSSDISKVLETIKQKNQLVGLNLEYIIRNPGSKFDLNLEEGDLLIIPKQLQTVQLLGEIYFPKKVRFDKSTRFKDYVRGAGGFTSSALRRRSYVVYANGEVKSTRKLLFFNSFPKVKAGAEIYVPKKREQRGLSTQEAVGLTTGFASLALIVITVLDKIK